MSEDFLLRIPPHDLEAEMSVLGAILLDNGVTGEAVEIIEPRDFYSARNREIYTAMLRLWGDHVPNDPVTLIAELRSRGVAEDGTAGYLAELADAVPTARHIAHYAKTVHDLALVRDFGLAAHSIALDSFDARAADFLTDAQARLDAVHGRAVAPREASMAEVTAAVLRDLCDKDCQPARIATPLKTLNALLDGGLGRGELIVLAGLTGRGKSSLALNIAVAAAKAKFGVLFVSLEMPQEQLIERALCAEARVNPGARKHGFRADELERLGRAQRELAACALEIKYRPGLKPTALRALAQRFKREQGGSFALLVVDYIGLMQSDRREERREREVASVSAALKGLAGELDIAVLALSQFSRAPERRDDRTPRLSDLRDSGAVEQDSDVVMLLHAENGDGERDEQVQIIVAKNRRGVPWVEAPAHFVAAQTRFEDGHQ